MLDDIKKHVVKFDFVHGIIQGIVYLSMMLVIFKYGDLSNPSMRLGGLLSIISYIIVVGSPIVSRKSSAWDKDCYEFYILPAIVLITGIVAYLGCSFYYWDLAINTLKVCVFNVIYLCLSPLMALGIYYARILATWES
ncbi:hypothetical protein [Capnocytophaga gingivalis]|uniref:hypothetical protein n=1 Tax=Capnocytophaga gingivalis TaxID=1017 RepID=UPI00058FDA78|nr:hypothetical protein [Capnocytophaga gingivalis]